MIQVNAEKGLYTLFIDGTPIDNAKVIYDEATARYKIRVLDAETGDLLTSHPLAGLPTLSSLRLQYNFSWSEKLDALVLYVRLASDPKKDDSYVLQFGFQRGFSDWKTLYGFDDYMHGLKEFSRRAGDTEPKFYQDARSDGQTEGFVAEFPFSVTNQSIGTEINRCALHLVELHSKVREREALAPARDRSIEIWFNFPTEVRVSCQQYLLYFVEFLRDLGVEAASELRDGNAGRVLFTVRPIEKQEALERIRVALEAYLHLPAAQIEGVSLLENELGIQRLEANIEHLRSELTLATLQAKDVTIEAMRVVNEYQRKLLTGEVVYASVEEPKRLRNEDVFGKLMQITPYEGKGFIVNLPEFYRRLKKLFSEE